VRIYPLYEFPKNIYQFKQLLLELDKYQPIDKEDAIALVEKLFGKRTSRSEITIRNLRDLGVLSGRDRLMLSPETQLYLDMDKNLSNLLMFYVYKQPALFQLCIDLIKIDGIMEMNNPLVLSQLYQMGYKEERLGTGREKIYGIKRLVNCCLEENKEENPFLFYEKYQNFLEKLQETYFELTKGKMGDAIPIVQLNDSLVENYNFSISSIQHFFEYLYNDILHSRNIAFTTVNLEYAGLGYFAINQKNYYFIKLLSRILNEDTLF